MIAPPLNEWLMLVETWSGSAEPPLPPAWAVRVYNLSTHESRSWSRLHEIGGVLGLKYGLGGSHIWPNP